MHKITPIFAASLLLCLASQGSAQQRAGFSGVNPRDITRTEINTSNVVGGGRLPVYTLPKKSIFSSFPKLSLSNPFKKPVTGRSDLPPPSSFPGANYKSALTPMAPIIP